MSTLNERVALITGGSRGIGAAIAKRLAADGASVAITYAKEASAASAVVKAIELSGGKAVGTPGRASTSSGKVGPHMLSRAVVVTTIGSFSAFAAFASATTLCFSSPVE